MKARLSNYRQAPRKVRLVADLVRGKSISRALTELSAVHKRAAKPFEKLIRSALANAQQTHGASTDNLYVKEVQVNEGVSFTRHMPRAYGRATPINKRTSHIQVVLEEKPEQKREKIKEKK